jgi:hypothetical protein
MGILPVGKSFLGLGPLRSKGDRNTAPGHSQHSTGLIRTPESNRSNLKYPNGVFEDKEYTKIVSKTRKANFSHFCLLTETERERDKRSGQHEPR